jgi:hypothetical protein
VKRKVFLIVYLVGFLGIILGINLYSSEVSTIPSPRDFFGFSMGSDGNLAGWGKIVEYFQLLDEHSDRVIVRNLGETTLGNPFILVSFSAPDNLKNLEKYRMINKKLADPRGLSGNEIRRLTKEGKYVSIQTYSLHSTEVGGTQCTPELAYRLVTADDETTGLILKNTIFLMIPCFNPDGLNLVRDWFYKYKGTEYNNKRLPYLYHFYTGHDNNRDSYMLTQKESRHFAGVAYREWVPQSYVDHHHFGSNGARFYIPPYYDPIHPNVSPLIWREHQLYGAHIAVALEDAGKSGIESGVPFTGWWQASFHMSANYHNITGMLTESASAQWADPIYILPDQLSGTRGRPEYKPQMSMPRLWPGGWWRLRDVVQQQIIASLSVLELGARYRERLLNNMVLKANENIRLGESGPPYAFILPRAQHDFLTAVKLARTFQQNGVEIHRLDKPFRMGSRLFDTGSIVISCAQPMRSFVVSFLEQVNYPDNYWTRTHRTLEPMRPYDLAAYSVSEHMGVDAIPVMQPLRGITMSKVNGEITAPAGSVRGDGNDGFVFERRFNDAFIALNRLMKNGVKVEYCKDGFEMDGRYYAPGTLIARSGSGSPLEKLVRETAKELGLDFYTVPGDVSIKHLTPVTPPRLGLYKRYAGGNMDEGWTHWLLKDFEFSFDSLFNRDVQDRRKLKKYNVIIIPSDPHQLIVSGTREKSEQYQESSKQTPPEYRGGIGKSGMGNIREFVENGGTLIVLNQAYEFAMKTFDLPISDSSEELPSRQFFCPGSTLKITVDPGHPLGYGMPGNALALFRNSPILNVAAGDFKNGVSIPVRYAEQNILQSGWLLGENYLSRKPAVAQFNVNKGRVVILAFPAQHRAQMHGTFKFLFNAIYAN